MNDKRKTGWSDEDIERVYESMMEFENEEMDRFPAMVSKRLSIPIERAKRVYRKWMESWSK